MLISSQADNLRLNSTKQIKNKRGDFMIYDTNNYTYNGLIVPVEYWAKVTDEMVPGVMPIYWVSNIGNFYNERSGEYSNAKAKPGDYIRVLLDHTDGSKHMTTIHRLVCMAFHGLPPGPMYDVDHINCDKSCSFEGNLEWVTRKENCVRAHNNNLCQVGEDYHNSIFTNEEVHEICRMLSEGVPIKTIVKIMEEKIYPRKYSYRMSDIIYQILHRIIWTSVSKDYVFHDYSRIHLNSEQVHLACKALEDGYSYDTIIDIVLGMQNCDDHKRERIKETLYNIKRGKSFTNISSNYNIINTRKFTLTNDELHLVCCMVAEGKSNQEILSSLGIRGNEERVKTAVYDIQRGSCHRNIVEYYKNKLSEGSTTIP